MLWIILALVAAIAGALCTFLDNFITDVFFKERFAQAQKKFFGPAYLVTAVLLLLLAPISPVSVIVAVGLIAAGLISGLSMIPYYVALEKDDATNVTILEQLSPIFYLIFGRFILGDDINGTQLIGFLVVLIAPIIIIFSSRKRSKESKLEVAGLVILKVALGALSSTLIVFFAKDLDFTTILFYVFIGKGIFDTVTSNIIKKWRKRYRAVEKKNRGFKFYTTLSIDHILWCVFDFAYYSALLAAPTVAMASAITKTLHPILVFMFGIILTVLWPNFGREKLKKKTILIHLIATVIAVIGISIMQI